MYSVQYGLLTFVTLQQDGILTNVLWLVAVVKSKFSLGGIVIEGLARDQRYFKGGLFRS